MLATMNEASTTISTTAAGDFRAGRVFAEGRGGPAAGEDSVMGLPIANEFEVLGEAGFVQHAVGVPANRKDASAFDEMMIVEGEGGFAMGNAAFVDDSLAVILASRFEPVDLEQAIGGGVEESGLEFFAQGLIGDGDRTVRHETRIGEAGLFRESKEVIPIKSAAEALPLCDGIMAQSCGQTAVSINVGEVELAAGLQEIMDLTENGFFVLHEIDHAVRNDDVEAGGFEIELVEGFDIALNEGDVREAEFLRMPVLVRAGDGELLRGHVDADHFAFRADKLGEGVGVLAGTGAEIEDSAALKGEGGDQPAAVITGADLRMDIRQQGLEIGGHVFDRTTRIGLEVRRGGQGLAIVVFDILLNVHVAPLKSSGCYRQIDGSLSFVIAGFIPAIQKQLGIWIPGASPGMTIGEESPGKVIEACVDDFTGKHQSLARQAHASVTDRDDLFAPWPQAAYGDPRNSDHRLI